MESTSDIIAENIEKAKQGDQKAFSFLLDTFWHEVYGFQLARTRDENDAEDISIQTFSRAFDKIESYNEQFEFKTWLFTISRNIHVDMIRRRKTNILNQASKEPEDAVYDVIDSSPSAEDRIIIEQNLAKLLRDIKKLKPHYQEVINLRYFQELTYQEIANRLSEPLNNIKVKLLRAKKLLAEIIQEES